MKIRNIILPLVLMILILILSFLPMDKIKCQIKHRLGRLVILKAQIQNLLHIRISFSLIQNILHVPFFALLAFFWMKFFNKRKAEFMKAFIYTLILTFLFSVFEEFCQFFIAGRDASFGDLFLNFTGCLVGIGIYRWRTNSRYSIRDTK